MENEAAMLEEDEGAMMEEEEGAQQKKGHRSKYKKKRAESSVVPSLLATAEPEPGPPVLPAFETLPSEMAAAIREQMTKKQGAAPVSPCLKQGHVYVTSQDAKKKRFLASSHAAGTPILKREDNGEAAEGEMERKKQRRLKMQAQSVQLSVPLDIHLQGGQDAAEGTKGKKTVNSCSSQKYRVLSNRGCGSIRMMMELRKNQPLPEGIVSFEEMVASSNLSSTSVEPNPNHSLLVSAFLYQFCYKSDRQQDGNALPHPRTAATRREQMRKKQATALESPSLKQVHVSITNQDAEKKPVLTSSDTAGARILKREDNWMAAEGAIERKNQPLPEGVVSTEMVANSNVSFTLVEPNPNHSSPFSAFFDQFRYKPDRYKDRNALAGTPDRPTRPPLRGHPSSKYSHLATNESSRARKPITLISRQTSSASTSDSHEKVQVKEKEKPHTKKIRKEKQRKPKALLTTEEKRSEKYRRLSPDQLVPPLRSPHRLLQEKYASDPWKVIVICMLLNVTQGKQVQKKVKGFFKRYPDAQSASVADIEEMAEYLAPLGLQLVKSKRIRMFSRQYIKEEWTYVTELCGVGKYAADAYAIFCAGRATEVVPKDHKLIDYWNYVCSKLHLIKAENESRQIRPSDSNMHLDLRSSTKGSQNALEPDARELGDLVPNKLQDLSA